MSIHDLPRCQECGTSHPVKKFKHPTDEDAPDFYLCNNYMCTCASANRHYNEEVSE